MDFCCQDGNDIFHRVLFFPHEFRCLLTKQSLMLPEQKPALSVLCAWLSKKKKKKGGQMHLLFAKAVFAALLLTGRP